MGGGEVRKLHGNSGAVRVFASGQERPALALTRSLGATGSADAGVSPEAEIAVYQLRHGVDVLLLLGTDGLFEFCKRTDAIERLLREEPLASVLEELCEESRKRWVESSCNGTVDDITAIALTFPRDP